MEHWVKHHEVLVIEKWGKEIWGLGIVRVFDFQTMDLLRWLNFYSNAALSFCFHIRRNSKWPLMWGLIMLICAGNLFLFFYFSQLLAFSFQRLFLLIFFRLQGKVKFIIIFKWWRVQFMLYFMGNIKLLIWVLLRFFSFLIVVLYFFCFLPLFLEIFLLPILRDWDSFCLWTYVRLIF